MEKKIERIQIGQLKSLDGTQTDTLEMPLDCIDGHIFLEQRIEFRFPRNEPDISRVPFVTGSPMSNLQ